jgi:hypothetical protein
MANIHISDLTTTELQELDLLADSENDLENLSDMELNNVQGGAPVVLIGLILLLMC